MKLITSLLICCLQFLTLIAEISDSFYNGEEYTLFAETQKCSQILKEFSDSAANFTRCSINSARPVSLCEDCINDYLQFRDKFQDLLKTVINGTSCESVLISNDRLNAVLEYHNNILSVWNKGNCNACYDWADNIPRPSNNTLRFNRMFSETEKCILDNRNNNNTEVCHNCKQSYLQLDNFYQLLSPDATGVDVICMDIVDKMNATRFKWSKILNCCELRHTPEILFLCCTAIITLLPFIFYFSLRYCGPIRDLPNVLNQSRFKQTIGSINARLHRRSK